MWRIDWKQYIQIHKERLLALFVALQVVSATFVVPAVATSTSENGNTTCDLIELLDWIDSEEIIQLVSISSSKNTTVNESSRDKDRLSTDKEQQLGIDPNSADTDCDGITDYEETNGGQPVDTDQDGTIDALDSDSDNDGISDKAESTEDRDGNGIANYRDCDSDGDGRSDTTEHTNGTDPERDSPAENITDQNKTSEFDSPETPNNRSDTIKDDRPNHSSGEQEPSEQEDDTGEHGGHTSTTSNENLTNTFTTTSTTSSSETTHTHTETTETNTQSSTGTTSSTTTETVTKTSQRTGSQDVPGSDTLPNINSPFIALVGLLCVLVGLIAITRRGN